MRRISASAAVSALTLAALSMLGAMPDACLADTAGTPDNVDTGIRKTQCYRTGSNALVACKTADLPAQDGALGRDTDPSTNDSGDGLLGLSFVRICNSGDREGTGACPVAPVPGYGPGDWGCVTDTLTGIMWEVKAPTGPRGRDLRYTNYSATYDPLGQYGSATDATGFVNALNASALCGFTDWNLAHSDKVTTIVSYGITQAGAARVDPSYFPTIQADWYWNDSPNLSSASTAFAVDFGAGVVSNSADRSTQRYVQGLRNGKAVVGPNGRFEFSADGTEVLDTTQTARLTWRRCVEGMAWNGTTCVGTPLTFTHEQALQRAAQQAAASGEAWRVPSVKELNWIVDREIPSPPIRHFAFPNTPAVATWASSPEVRQPAFAWAIDFSVGLDIQHARTEALVLRLARDPDTP